MLIMSVPWYEFILRATVVYVFLLLILRIAGKRQIGQLAPFDLVLLLVLSNAVQNSMNAGDNSLVGGLISALSLVIINYLVGVVAFKSKKVRVFVEGTPQFLIRGGRVFHDIMSREKISDSDLHQAIRQAGLNSPHEVEYAILETNGQISVLKKHSK